MGIWDRLGNVINSYINDLGEQTFSRSKSYSGGGRSGDPDFDAAFDELNDYLNGNEKHSGAKRSESSGQYSWRDAGTSGKDSRAGGSLPPEELRADFELLGVPFGADMETCKTAYKNLLKIHHPDHHSGHEANYKKATEKSAKINAAWDRIEKWRANGSIA